MEDYVPMKLGNSRSVQMDIIYQVKEADIVVRDNAPTLRCRHAAKGLIRDPDVDVQGRLP